MLLRCFRRCGWSGMGGGQSHAHANPWAVTPTASHETPEKNKGLVNNAKKLAPPKKMLNCDYLSVLSKGWAHNVYSTQNYFISQNTHPWTRYGKGPAPESASIRLDRLLGGFRRLGWYWDGYVRYSLFISVNKIGAKEVTNNKNVYMMTNYTERPSRILKVGG